MKQIKIFIGTEDHPSDLEDQVNTWIAQAGVEVLSITGNISPQSVLPDKNAGGTKIDAMGGTGRRFAPSDIFVLVTYNAAYNKA